MDPVERDSVCIHKLWPKNPSTPCGCPSLPSSHTIYTSAPTHLWLPFWLPLTLRHVSTHAVTCVCIHPNASFNQSFEAVAFEVCMYFFFWHTSPNRDIDGVSRRRYPFAASPAFKLQALKPIYEGVPWTKFYLQFSPISDNPWVHIVMGVNPWSLCIISDIRWSPVGIHYSPWYAVMW